MNEVTDYKIWQLETKIIELESKMSELDDIIRKLDARDDYQNSQLNELTESIRIHENRIIALEHRVHYLEDDVLHVDLY